MVYSNNIRAFFDTIAFSEGTDDGKQPTKNHGYDVVVGGSLFSNYNDHPRRLVQLPKYNIKSTAAGRYQILAGIFDFYKKELKLPDFSPASQDAIAYRLIKECKAVDDIEAGRITEALHKCRSRWASLPGAGYGQHEKKATELVARYNQSLSNLA